MVKTLQNRNTGDFLFVWRMLEKLPTAVRKLTLLYLPWDHLWMFWKHFSTSFFRDVYFSQYEIKAELANGDRLMRQCEEGEVFPNLTSLSFYCMYISYSLIVSTFNRAFPLLRELTIINLTHEFQALPLIHPKIEVVDLTTAVCQPRLKYILEVDWSLKLPSLKLMYLSHIMWGNVALCNSSGLPLIRLGNGVRKIGIIHIGILTEGWSIFDIGLLPSHPYCRMLFLAAKSYTNFDDMLTIRDKFPELSEVYIYTSSLLDEEVIQKVSVSVEYCHVRDLRELQYRICSMV